MKIPEKTLSRVDFIKHFLRDISKCHKCEFCKYNIKNYKIESTGRTAVLFFNKSKCSVCIHYSNNNLEKSKNNAWINDKFKPLYEWEEEKEYDD